jgi:hypothetical protein
MIEKDDAAARKARAESLMDEVERLTAQSESDKDENTDETKDKGTEETKRPPNPREFIHKRMRELDKREKREDSNKEEKS